MVNIKRVISDLGSHPIALAGCHANNAGYSTCIHDIVIFDEDITVPSTVHACDDLAVIVHHGSINESRSTILAGYSTMSIIQDDTMVLAPLIQNTKARIAEIFCDCARISLTNSMVCTARAQNANTPTMEICWQKCANMYLCDAVLAMNHHVSSTHALEHLRHVKDYSETVARISGMWGTERASTTLLNRMGKAVTGIHQQQAAEIIQYKTDILLQEQRLADCYHYLCHQASTAMYANPAHHEFVYGIAMDAGEARDDTSLIRHEIESVLENLNSLIF